VRKYQWILIIAGAAVVFCMYDFGRIVNKHAAAPAAGQAAAAMGAAAKTTPASFSDILAKAKAPLSPAMQMRLSNLENSVTRGALKQERVRSYHSLAHLWDSLGSSAIAAHYLGEEAKLENSKNSLTFAANLFLAHLQDTADASIRQWEANQAESLLLQASGLDPENDTIQVALANSEVMGGEVMQGVQRLLKITGKDPRNVPANLMLGRLSVTSGQYQKAVEHLETVVNQEPDNTEALYFLAEAYKATGKKDKAIATFERCKKLVNNPDFSKEIDQYIKSF
jgi:predicted Zn-dependent protease